MEEIRNFAVLSVMSALLAYEFVEGFFR